MSVSSGGSGIGGPWWSRSSLSWPRRRSDRISRAARLTYGQLARFDPLNDGQVIWYDQLVPGGFLLGYANADHWAIAIPVSEDIPSVSFMFRDDFPRAAMVRAALEVVAATLSAREGD